MLTPHPLADADTTDILARAAGQSPDAYRQAACTVMEPERLALVTQLATHGRPPVGRLLALPLLDPADPLTDLEQANRDWQFTRAFEAMEA